MINDLIHSYMEDITIYTGAYYCITYIIRLNRNIFDFAYNKQDLWIYIVMRMLIVIIIKTKNF